MHKTRRYYFLIMLNLYIIYIYIPCIAFYYPQSCLKKKCIKRCIVMNNGIKLLTELRSIALILSMFWFVVIDYDFTPL